MISSRTARAMAVPGIASLAVLGLVVLAALDQNRIDDDAYMFVRYARNFINDGSIAWNPGGAPTYGLTSLAYFGVVLLLQLTLRADPAVVLVASTLLCGSAFVIALAWLVWRWVDTESVELRAAATSFVLLGLAWAGRGLSVHFITGMDTTCTLLYGTAYIAAAKAWQARPSSRRTWLLGTAGGAAHWVRPELLLYACALPLAGLLLAPSSDHSRAARRAFAITLAMAAVLAAVAWLYFGSPVPLSTFGKVLRGYGPDMKAVYRAAPGEQLALFARDYAPFMALAALGFVPFVRARGARMACIEIGLAAATLAFLVFHRFFVLAVMGSGQRFDYPTLPAIAFLAAQGAVALATHPRALRLWQRFAPTPSRARLAAGIATGLALASLVLPAVRAITELARGPRFSHFSVADNYANNWHNSYWPRLDRFSSMPDDLVIGTTEIGYPGVLNPRKVIVDLAGLNDSEFARHGFSPRSLFGRYRPDLMLLPTRHYQELRSALTHDPEFTLHYQVFQPKYGLGIALRRDSKYYDAMRAALAP